MYIIQRNNRYEILFNYNPRIINAVKNLPGRHFDYVTKIWWTPLSFKKSVEEFARKNNFTIKTPEAPKKIDYTIPPMPDLNINIPLKMEMFPFQKTGVAYALAKKRLIIGDQPGLGKTVQAIATVVAAKAFPCLVIGPASLKLNWQREIEMWTNYKPIILNDSIRNTFNLFSEANLAQFFIVNYESLKKYFVEDIQKDRNGKWTLKNVLFNLKKDMFKSVIIDESHRVKSTATQQTKFTKGICKGKEYILALTGTPVVNKPRDLVAQLGIIDRMQDMGGYSYFIDHYCDGLDGHSNLEELNFRLKTTCFYRRDKSAVLKDLPAKIRQKVLCDIDNWQEYNTAVSDLETYLKQYREATDEQIQKSMKGEVIVRINVLKNISARGKIEGVFEFIDDVIESGEKLVIFGHLREVLGKVKERYKKIAVSITGEDDTRSRQQAVDSFQNDPETTLCICSIQAAGVGITLTAASRIAFIEMGWHPAIMEQCEDRCHRIGQTDSVQCTYFLGQGTIDEWVYDIIESKRVISDTITGSQEKVEWSVIDNVINLFNQKRRKVA